jgi:hypothetical protein
MLCRHYSSTCVFDRLNTEIMGSNPTQGMDVCSAYIFDPEDGGNMFFRNIG